MNRNSKSVYLITSRFALKNNIFRTNLYEDWTEDDWVEFLKNREQIFTNYNVPSLAAQTDKRFEYWVYLDPTFPGIRSVLPAMKQTAKEHDFIRLIQRPYPWGDGGPLCPMFPYIQNHITKYVGKFFPECKWLITTRLDSDDLLSKDFIEATYNNFEYKEKWISFKHGYCYLTTRKEFIKYKDWKSCHVIYGEPFNVNRMAKTVWHRCHAKLGLTEKNTEQIKIISTPDRGWWLDLVGLNSNLARHDTYLEKDNRSQRLWSCPRVTEDEIKQYITFKDLGDVK